MEALKNLTETESLIENNKKKLKDIPLNTEKTRVLHIQTTGGRLRVLHINSESCNTLRPVIFLPGWGTLPEGFTDFFIMLHEDVECYYIETREKNSSRLSKKNPEMDMDRNAQDLEEIIEQLGFSGVRDYVLMGTCWGSTVISHTLSRGKIKPPTAVVFDPMPGLWFPQWLLKTIVPLLPDPVWNLLRPIGRMIALSGMKEETQKKRAESFINSADLKKWKAAALAIMNYNLFDIAPKIETELLIFTGVEDKIHDQSIYPDFAKAVQSGRFFNLPVHESYREYLLGLIAKKFSQCSREQEIPEEFRKFEVKF